MFEQTVKALRIAGYKMQGQGWTDNETVLDARRACIEANNISRVLHRAIARNPERNDIAELIVEFEREQREFWSCVDTILVANKMSE